MVTQPGDEAEETRQHQIKAWEASKVSYRGAHGFLHACFTHASVEGRGGAATLVSVSG